jgi:hypothetical protein
MKLADAIRKAQAKYWPKSSTPKTKTGFKKGSPELNEHFRRTSAAYHARLGHGNPQI